MKIWRTSRNSWKMYIKCGLANDWILKKAKARLENETPILFALFGFVRHRGAFPVRGKLRRLCCAVLS